MKLCLSGGISKTGKTAASFADSYIISRIFTIVKNIQQNSLWLPKSKGKIKSDVIKRKALVQ